MQDLIKKKTKLAFLFKEQSPSLQSVLAQTTDGHRPRAPSTPSVVWANTDLSKEIVVAIITWFSSYFISFLAIFEQF